MFYFILCLLYDHGMRDIKEYSLPENSVERASVRPQSCDVSVIPQSFLSWPCGQAIEIGHWLFHQVVFEAVVGDASVGDIAIDDIEILNGPCPPEGECTSI